MMAYDEFKKVLTEAVQENVGPKKKVKVFLKTVKKCNVKMREGITYEYEDSEEKILGVPIVYLDDLYESYEEEGNLAEIIACVVNVFMNSEPPEEVFSVPDWNLNKNNVFMKLINPKYNLHMLDSHVHKQFLDLCIVFSISLGNASMDITKQMLETWSITEEELYKTALENQRSSVCVLDDLRSFLPPMMVMEVDDAPYMFVITNENRLYGASEIICTERLQEFAEIQNSNLYLLPSSRHEMLLICEENATSAEELQKVVYEINHNEAVLKWEDYLSDSVYYYDRFEREISIAA